MTEAMGAEATHESVHASDALEVHKDIQSANGGPKRTEEEYERKARQKNKIFVMSFLFKKSNP